MANPTPTRGDLLHAAFTVAQQFRDYGTYGDEKKACKAIARKCVGFSDSQYTNALAKTLRLYDRCIRIMGHDGATYAENADLNLVH